MRHGLFTIVLAAFVVMSSQAKSPERTRAESEVKARTGADALWPRDQAARAQASEMVTNLLRKPLTVSSAVQIALLNNRSLQATFEEIGIGRADLIEAVTAPNPTVDFDVQFPVTGTVNNRYAWLVAQEFVQILMIPLKKRISEEALEAAELRVADEILGLVARVKKSYFTIQAGQQLLGRLRIIQETNAASLDLAQKQFKAGNITDLALLQMQASYGEGRLEIAEAESAIEEHREELNECLGLWGTQTGWEIHGDLSRPENEDFSAKHLESLAIAQRLDLRAAHRELTSLVSALGLIKTFRWVPMLDLGFSGERDIDEAHPLNMGPSIRLEVPIFNRGQSRIAHAEAELGRASANFEALAVHIRSETRKFRTKLANLSERVAFYHDTLLPNRIRIVNKALLEYNAMQAGPYDLFVAKAEELKVERGSIDALRDYWTTRAELERAVGGTLTPKTVSSRKPSATKE